MKTTIFNKYFRKNFRLEGLMSPTVMTSAVDGKKYAISGSNWIHIPGDMTFEEVKLGFVDLRPVSKEQDNVYKEIKSSNGKSTYKVSFRFGSWNCTCSGFGFRRKCSHIEGVKNDLKKLF